MSMPEVVCLPGSVPPAAQRYGPLVEAVGGGANIHFQDLEVYSEDAPPQGYSIEMELDRAPGSRTPSASRGFTWSATRAEASVHWLMPAPGPTGC